MTLLGQVWWRYWIVWSEMLSGFVLYLHLIPLLYVQLCMQKIKREMFYLIACTVNLCLPQPFILALCTRENLLNFQFQVLSWYFFIFEIF